MFSVAKCHAIYVYMYIHAPHFRRGRLYLFFNLRCCGQSSRKSQMVEPRYQDCYSCRSSPRQTPPSILHSLPALPLCPSFSLLRP
ncbi:hypothetical protein I7I48_09452 [Histoplasma ohiense]|nr:hypothetical protein I7I48_09452 [Histoplasma ohiense (nom. inval.)]